MIRRDHETTDRGQVEVFPMGIITAVVIVLAIFFFLSIVASGVVDAQANNTTVKNETDYYETPPAIDNASWTQGRRDPTLDNTTNWVTRFSTFVIGEDSTDDISNVGPLLTGVVVLGFAGGTLGASRTGVVAGMVGGTILFGSLVEVGLAPVWLWTVVLMAIAIVLGLVWLRGSR